MSDFKDLAPLTLMVADCDDAIRRQGARAKVVFRIPGEWGCLVYKKLFPGGPRGWIMAETNDRRKLIVMFGAAKAKIALEKRRNDIEKTLLNDSHNTHGSSRCVN